MNALSPLGWLYGVGSSFRNALYDRGIFRSHSLGARTISIGNLTAGGTGKTPLVALVAGRLAENREKVCILTRGYGRENPAERVVVSDGQNILADARAGGDEPVELAEKLIGKAIVIADRDRVAAARWAIQEFSPTVFVLDDGFQHRRAERDLDIVCIDATDPFGGGRSLPAGRLRERPSNLDRADAAVLTRAELADDLAALEWQVRQLAPKIEIFHASYRTREFKEIGSQNTIDIAELRRSAAFAFCGLGDPKNFFAQLEREGVRLVGRKAFPDHHAYTADDVRSVEASARSAGAEVLITTAKDAVRLDTSRLELKYLVAEIDVRITDDDRFRHLIVSTLA
jgi:tetraacyldisaccharide 4'-kinase